MANDKHEATAAVVAGIRLQCPVCGDAEFHHRRAQLHGAVSTFFNMEWLGPSAEIYVCAKCGHVQWFMPVGKQD